MKRTAFVIRMLFVASLIAVPVGAFGILFTWVSASPVPTGEFTHPYRLVGRGIKLFPVYLTDFQVTSYETFHFITVTGFVVLFVMSAAVLGLKKFAQNKGMDA